MDSQRTVTVGLGGAGDRARLSVDFEGSACRCEDFQMALVGFAKQWLRDRAERDAKEPQPCGCEERNA
jgi:hypothetical protein